VPSWVSWGDMGVRGFCVGRLVQWQEQWQCLNIHSILLYAHYTRRLPPSPTPTHPPTHTCC
jgi:hypothetical protein